MNYLPLLIFVLVIGGLVIFAGRARRKQAAEQARRVEEIVVGTDVMTTSGLHGTVVTKSDDGTVQMSIAPGVEVRWELAALRDVASLPTQFRNEDADGEIDQDIDHDTDEDAPAGVDLEKGDTSRGADPAA